MVATPRRPSAGMRSIHRELERRRAKPLAPKLPTAPKPSVPRLPAREGAHGKVLKPCPRPVRENPSSTTSSMSRSGSAGTNPPPANRPRLRAPPRASSEVSLLPPPPFRYDSSQVGSKAHLKPASPASPSPSFPASTPMAPPPRSCFPSVRSTSAGSPISAGHLEPLAPKSPAYKKRSPPSSRGGAHGKVLKKPCARPIGENQSSITSAGTHPPPPSRYVSSSSHFVFGASAPLKPTRRAPPRPSSAAPTQPVPSPPTGSSSSANPSTAGHLKPGTRVAVRTRSQAVIDGKTLVLWLPATVVSAIDGSYEVIYDGNLPREDPFSTVHVPLQHVRPIKPSQPTPQPPPSQPPSVAAGSSASATNTQTAASKSLEMLPGARPTTMGKSLRLVHDLAPQMRPPPRPTTAGKSLRLVSNIRPKMQQAPTPTAAGKSLCLVRDPAGCSGDETSSKADHDREEH